MKTIIQAILIGAVIGAAFVATFAVTADAHNNVTKIILTGMK